MTSQPADESRLENFDELFVGDPAEAERNLRELLPEARARSENSIYLQILSLIALAQAMQKNFDAAHATLDEAEQQLSSGDHIARVRILLERGRVYHQSDDVQAARPLYQESYELSAEHGFDYHTINAAHMIAIVAETVEEKISWNELAIQLAEKSTAARGQAWLGALYNNVGQNYLEAERFEDALMAFKKCLSLRKEEGLAVNVRVAHWAVARSLRLLNRPDEAMPILLELLEAYEAVANSEEPDMPLVMLPSVRGLVYEELAEIHAAQAKAFARRAFDDLSQDEWFKKQEAGKLERMRQLRG